jgi:Protein of unknown function (DUF551)
MEIEWISTDEENPPPSLDRCFLITDGNTVSLGMYEELGEAEWSDIAAYSSFLSYKGTLGKITHWSPLPSPPIAGKNEN